MKNALLILKDFLIRSIGVVMAFFIGGAAIGSSTVGWFMGGVIGVGTVFSGIIVFLGIQLVWFARLTLADIEKAFRAAVAEQAKDNEDIAEALKTSASAGPDLADFGDLDELEA